jgi:hypothetical protein
MVIGQAGLHAARYAVASLADKEVASQIRLVIQDF